MGCCHSHETRPPTHAVVVPSTDVPLPVIGPPDAETTSLFSPSFRPPIRAAPAKPGSDRVSLAVPPEEPDSPHPPSDGTSDSSEAVDHDLIQRLLADVDRSD
jgi:hypothetical protein